MILAAGLGTRLRPLTNTRPKALVEVNHVPLLEIVLKRLISAGVTEVIINVHHFAERIADFLRAKSNFGIRIELSYEEKLLDTGGGIKNASYFFDDRRPFFVHNVDILSEIDLNEMYRYHLAHGGLATLAVNQHETSRYLIFDEEDKLCGWKSLKQNINEMVRPPIGETHFLGFCGIHVISPGFFEKMTEQGAFSIIKCYLRLAGLGENILAFDANPFYWRDVGTLKKLQQI